jgi:quercetin dioxygenase-like cupin family protein
MSDAAADWTFSDSSEIEWQPLGPDIEMKMLAAANGQAIGLFRFAPGYQGAAHVHERAEFAYVLEGELMTTGTVLGPGAAYSAASGTTHDEFGTTTGCTIVSVFATRE